MATKSITRETDHRERLLRKIQKRDALAALLEEWTAAGYNETDMYVCDIAHRLRLVEIQLRNMRP